MPELSDEELNALVEEATVDAYGDDEQLGGFAVPTSATTSSPAAGFGSVPGRTSCGCAMPPAPGRSGSSMTVSL
jgi:hypothetical protein